MISPFTPKSSSTAFEETGVLFERVFGDFADRLFLRLCKEIQRRKLVIGPIEKRRLRLPRGAFAGLDGRSRRSDARLLRRLLLLVLNGGMHAARRGARPNIGAFECWLDPLQRMCRAIVLRAREILVRRTCACLGASDPAADGRPRAQQAVDRRADGNQPETRLARCVVVLFRSAATLGRALSAVVVFIVEIVRIGSRNAEARRCGSSREARWPHTRFRREGRAGTDPSPKRRGSARIASPITPPRPVGSGQRSVTGKSERTPAVATEPAIQSISRRRARSSRRSVRSLQPQQATGIRAAMDASPSICITRSAVIAPAGPRRLRVGPDVA